MWLAKSMKQKYIKETVSRDFRPLFFLNKQVLLGLLEDSHTVCLFSDDVPVSFYVPCNNGPKTDYIRIQVLMNKYYLV